MEDKVTIKNIMDLEMEATNLLIETKKEFCKKMVVQILNDLFVLEKYNVITPLTRHKITEEIEEGIIKRFHNEHR